MKEKTDIRVNNEQPEVIKRMRKDPLSMILFVIGVLFLGAAIVLDNFYGDKDTLFILGLAVLFCGLALMRGVKLFKPEEITEDIEKENKDISIIGKVTLVLGIVVTFAFSPINKSESLALTVMVALLVIFFGGTIIYYNRKYHNCKQEVTAKYVECAPSRSFSGSYSIKVTYTYEGKTYTSEPEGDYFSRKEIEKFIADDNRVEILLDENNPESIRVKGKVNKVGLLAIIALLVVLIPLTITLLMGGSL